MDTLHPMLVHVPIGLALIWPLVDLAGAAAKRPDVGTTAVVLLGLALPASLVATVSGQRAYDAAIAAGAAPELLDTHADYAGLFPWLLLAVLALRTLGVKKYGAPLRWVSIALGLILIGFVVWIGSTGGELVFGHGVGVRAT
ncbi:MAG: hypothetical protein HYV07_09200 [Deltaproteobacteria bacterium]|nr:hypothetical protein [Deltaproteobacteria bacterium]